MATNPIRLIIFTLNSIQITNQIYECSHKQHAKDNKKTRWFERIGMAVSKDMVRWIRYPPEPLVHHPVGITGDPYLQKIGDVWVMFYFGAFWQDRKGAFNRQM